MLTNKIKGYVDRCILCWLATASSDNIPNVSPKELFTYHGEQHLLIANIASPQSLKNIQANNNVCISFVDVFVQKGFQIKGIAKIIAKHDPTFEPYAKVLLQKLEQDFPVQNIFEISIQSVKPIIAPSYFLYPDTTEQAQIESAKKAYGVK